MAVGNKIGLLDVVCKKQDKYGAYIVNISEEHYKRLHDKFGEYGDNVPFNKFDYDTKSYYNIKVKKERVCDDFESFMNKRIDAYLTIFPWEFGGKEGVSASVDLCELRPIQKKEVKKEDYLLE